jgi:hypothetical protein
MASAAAAGAKRSDHKISAGATTIAGASTVAKRTVAYKDKALTSMVPAHVMVRREAAAAAAAAAGKSSSSSKAVASEEVRIGPGFGLAPVQKNAVGVTQRQQQQQPAQVGKWGSMVQTVVAPAGKPRPAAAAGAAKTAAAPASVDAKMNEFMSSLKDLGAFE